MKDYFQKRFQILVVLMLSFLANISICFSQEWSRWIKLGESNEADVSISFRIRNNCSKTGGGGYSYFRTLNNTYHKGGRVFITFRYTDCDGKETKGNKTVYLSETGVDEKTGYWFFSNGSGVRDVRLEELYLPEKKIWRVLENGVEVDMWKRKYGTQQGDGSSFDRPDNPDQATLQPSQARTIVAPQIDYSRPHRYEEADKKTQDIQRNTDARIAATSAAGSAIEAIGTSLYTLWANKSARKEAASKQMVYTFAKGVYDNKKNDLYYQEVVCERCGGSGQHSYTESRSLAGQYFDCRECNTIGKLKTLRPDFQMTLANTHTQETIDFLTYLFEVSSNKKPLFTIRPTEYKGTIYIYSKAAAGASNNTPVFVVTRRFSFLDKNGKPDVDATALTRVVDKQVHPLDQIEGFKFISGKEVFSNGTSVTTNNHIQILSNTGETFEFVTEQNESLVIKKLHQLLEIAKSKQRELNSGI